MFSPEIPSTSVARRPRKTASFPLRMHVSNGRRSSDRLTVRRRTRLWPRARSRRRTSGGRLHDCHLDGYDVSHRPSSGFLSALVTPFPPPSPSLTLLLPCATVKDNPKVLRSFLLPPLLRCDVLPSVSSPSVRSWAIPQVRVMDLTMGRSPNTRLLCRCRRHDGDASAEVPCAT